MKEEIVKEVRIQYTEAEFMKLIDPEGKHKRMMLFFIKQDPRTDDVQITLRQDHEAQEENPLPTINHQGTDHPRE